jgi:hypothetical protein
MGSDGYCMGWEVHNFTSIATHWHFPTPLPMAATMAGKVDWEGNPDREMPVGGYRGEIVNLIWLSTPWMVNWFHWSYYGVRRLLYGMGSSQFHLDSHLDRWICLAPLPMAATMAGKVDWEGNPDREMPVGG